LWKAAVSGASGSTYSTIVAAELAGVRQYVAFLTKSLVGVAAGDGKLLWNYDKIASRYSSRTPIVHGDSIFCTNGATGVAMLKLIADGNGTRVEEKYFEKLQLNGIQDSSVPVVAGDYAFDLLQNSGALECIDVRTGKPAWQAKSPVSRGGRAS